MRGRRGTAAGANGVAPPVQPHGHTPGSTAQGHVDTGGRLGGRKGLDHASQNPLETRPWQRARGDDDLMGNSGATTHHIDKSPQEQDDWASNQGERMKRS
jgi:hypothetical protein